MRTAEATVSAGEKIEEREGNIQQNLLTIFATLFPYAASILSPGLNFIACPIQNVTGRLSLKVQQLDVRCETKTKDNVFVDVSCAVQYQVILGEVYNAFYRLTNPERQITSYVFDVIRSSLPKLDLDQAFASKDDIAEDVKNELQEVRRGGGGETKKMDSLRYHHRTRHIGANDERKRRKTNRPFRLSLQNMGAYGYKIIDTLITDLDPAARVKASMNEINASKRLREAAMHKADADKIRQASYS